MSAVRFIFVLRSRTEGSLDVTGVTVLGQQMIREILRKLRSGAIISSIWGSSLGLATLILVAGSFLIPSLNPSTEDLVQIPLCAAAGGFFLGTVFSTATVLGARRGRLPDGQPRLGTGSRYCAELQ